MNQIGMTKADEVIADNQPKCIYEIRQEGFNIKPTFKVRIQYWPVSTF